MTSSNGKRLHSWSLFSSFSRSGIEDGDGSEKMTSKNKYTIVAFAVIIVTIIMAVILLISRMNSSVSYSVYSERKTLLARLTESSASVINDNIEYGQSLIDIISDNAVHSLGNYSSISKYISDVRNRPGFCDYTFFFVDTNGKYYSSDGVNGKIIDTTYYTATSEDKLSYISSLPHLGTEDAFFIFRNRFQNPVPVNTDSGSAELQYCGMLYDINNLNAKVSQEFTGATNTFIFNDANGVMLYKHFGIERLIDGFNIYPKFSQCIVTYGEKPDDLIQVCRSRETLTASLTINGDEYYFCSAPIIADNWSVAFIVQSRYMDTLSGNSFGKIILYIALIAVILGAAIILIIYVVIKGFAAARSLKEITILNEELEKATKAKSDFLSNMSHDIRTPINGIMGMTTIAKGVEGNPEKTRECLEKIDGASRHLLSLINDVLDMSRIERGKTEISAIPIDIRTIVDNCCNIVKGQMADRNLQLSSEVLCEHTSLIGDDLHLRQIFINILGNAVKFTPDGGSIVFTCREIDCTETNATISFEIIDSGIGMKPEFLDKIFDVFTQDDNSARSKYKGTGLGMAITKQLTELMGGTIDVESELNKGSKFTVTIPFVINSHECGETSIDTTDTDIRGIKLLVAEDNELNMDIVLDLLGDAGALLTPVENGIQALDTFAGSEPGYFDAILMDVLMPEMNGLDATKAIRALPREDAKTIPVLAMTANAFEDDIKATREAGMNAHLVKPINIVELVSTIAFYTKRK